MSRLIIEPLKGHVKVFAQRGVVCDNVDKLSAACLKTTLLWIQLDQEFPVSVDIEQGGP